MNKSPELDLDVTPVDLEAKCKAVERYSYGVTRYSRVRIRISALALRRLGTNQSLICGTLRALGLDVDQDFESDSIIISGDAA